MLFPHLYNGNNQEVEICYSPKLSKKVEEDEVEQCVFWTFDCVVAEGNLKKRKHIYFHVFEKVYLVQACVSVSSWSWKGSCFPPTGTILRWNQRADFREESLALKLEFLKMYFFQTNCTFHPLWNESRAFLSDFIASLHCRVISKEFMSKTLRPLMWEGMCPSRFTLVAIFWTHSYCSSKEKSHWKLIWTHLTQKALVSTLSACTKLKSNDKICQAC